MSMILIGMINKQKRKVIALVDKEQYNKCVGQDGEYEFIKRLNTEGIPYEYADSWVDFFIHKKPIDVKTTRITHKFCDKRKNQRKNQPYKIGRFTFTKEQRDEQIHIAFFVRHKKEFLFMGIGKLPPNCPKYLSIHRLRTLDLLTIKEFAIKAKRLQNGNKP